MAAAAAALAALEKRADMVMAAVATEVATGAAATAVAAMGAGREEAAREVVSAGAGWAAR